MNDEIDLDKLVELVYRLMLEELRLSRARAN
jgi:hypothetical protein